MDIQRCVARVQKKPGKRAEKCNHDISGHAMAGGCCFCKCTRFTPKA